MRKGEIRLIKFEDINLELDQIKIPNQKNGKTSFIPMNKAAKDALMQLQTHPGLFDYDWKKAFLNALKKAKITDFRFHDLRHTFGTYALKNCKNLTTVQRIMRHADPKTTLRYAHTIDTELKSAVDNMWTVGWTVKDPNLMEKKNDTSSKSFAKHE
jgi:integrase